MKATDSAQPVPINDDKVLPFVSSTTAKDSEEKKEPYWIGNRQRRYGEKKAAHWRPDLD